MSPSTYFDNSRANSYWPSKKPLNDVQRLLGTDADRRLVRTIGQPAASNPGNSGQPALRVARGRRFVLPHLQADLREAQERPIDRERRNVRLQRCCPAEE